MTEIRHVLRLARHRSNPDLVVLHTPPDLAGAMGRFPAARYDPETRAYLVPIDALPGLHALATNVGAAVLDQRDNPASSERRTLPECRHCAQPARPDHQPSYCPGCGRLWDPVDPPLTADGALMRTACPACGRKQSGRFDYCQHCGTRMDYPPPGTRPAEHRTQLDEPLALGAAVDQLLDQLPGSER